MVIGKSKPTKSQSQSSKRVSGSGSSKNASAPSPGLASAKSSCKTSHSVSAPSCGSCGSVITDDTKALQCDRCVAPDIWKCANCLHLSDEMYDQLVSDSTPSLRWFCENCEKLVMETGSSPSVDRCDKLDNLIAVIEKLMAKYEHIESRLADKLDMGEAVKLEFRIKQVEDKLSTLGNDFESRLVPIENQFQTTNIGTNILVNDPDEEKIKVVVQEEMDKISGNQKDLENRKSNIIIFRVPEKKTERVAERSANDTVYVKDLLDCVFNMKVQEGDIAKMYRLGRWSEGINRPLLVAFKDCEMKDYIMSNLRNLKQPVEKFQGIGISHDFSPKERDDRRRMIQEAKLEHDDLGTDQSENYKFIVVGHGLRKRVIKIKKTGNSA